MKQITSISELKQGDKLVRFDGEDKYFYEFLMIHPHNENYVLVLDGFTQDAHKKYIPDMLNNDNWFMDYTIEELCEHRINYYKNMIERTEKRLENLRSRNKQ